MNFIMSNHALIAPKFVAAGPTTLVLKEKKGLSLSGMPLNFVRTSTIGFIVLIPSIIYLLPSPKIK